MLVGSHRAVCDLRFLVDGEQLCLGEVLEDVTHAEHDDSVADDQHALAAVLTRNHLGHTAQAKDHIAPALTARWPVVELSKQAPELCLVWELLHDADSGQSIENSKLLFAQPLIDHQ